MRSACASLSSPRFLGLVAAALVTAGPACDRLVQRPGADLGVELVGGEAVTLVGKVSLPLRLRVRGCADFTAEVRVPGVTRPLSLGQASDGTWFGEVPIASIWLEPVGAGVAGCAPDRSSPVRIDGEVAVTCTDALRTVRAPFQLTYATASVVREPSVAAAGDVQHLAPGRGALDPVLLRLLPVEHLAFVSPFGVAPYAPDPGRLWPPVALGPNSGYLAAGCDPTWGCPMLAGGAGPPIASERLAEITGHLPGDWAPAWVPAHVVDLAYTAAGDLLVLSQPVRPDLTPTEPGHAPISPRAVISRVTPGPAPLVTLVADLPGEALRTGFSRRADGRLAFVTFVVPDAPGRVEGFLRTTDGVTVDGAPLEAAGPAQLGRRFGLADGSVALELSAAAMSLDASRVMVRPPGPAPTVVSRPGTPGWSPVDLRYPATFELEEPGSGASWDGGLLVVWSGTQVGRSTGFPWLQAFDAAPPYPSRFVEVTGPLPGSPRSAALHGAIAVGDRVVATTNTGVRILDRDGHLVGGLDPFPCRLQTSAPAVQTGPAQFAVAAGGLVFAFDLEADP